jgi:hypothetical protein
MNYTWIMYGFFTLVVPLCYIRDAFHRCFLIPCLHEKRVARDSRGW